MSKLNRLYNFQSVLFLFKNYIGSQISYIYITSGGIIPHTGEISVSYREILAAIKPQINEMKQYRRYFPKFGYVVQVLSS
jgi:hypothetical protein